MIQAALMKLMDKGALSRDEAEAAMSEIMEGQATPALIAAFLVAPRLHVRAQLPPGHAPRRAGAPRTRHPHRVQPARPADQPRRSRVPGARRVGPARRADHRPRAGPTGHPPRSGGAWRWRPGRN